MWGALWGAGIPCCQHGMLSCEPPAGVRFPVDGNATSCNGVGGGAVSVPARPCSPSRTLGAGGRWVMAGWGGSAAMGTSAPSVPSLPSALPRICSLLPGAYITPLSLLVQNVGGIREVLAAGPCPHVILLGALSCLDLFCTGTTPPPAPSPFWGAPSPLMPPCPGIPPPWGSHSASRMEPG